MISACIPSQVLGHGLVFLVTGGNGNRNCTHRQGKNLKKKKSKRGRKKESSLKQRHKVVVEKFQGPEKSDFLERIS